MNPAVLTGLDAVRPLREDSVCLPPFARDQGHRDHRACVPDALPTAGEMVTVAQREPCRGLPAVAIRERDRVPRTFEPQGNASHADTLRTPIHSQY